MPFPCAGNEVVQYVRATTTKIMHNRVKGKSLPGMTSMTAMDITHNILTRMDRNTTNFNK